MEILPIDCLWYLYQLPINPFKLPSTSPQMPLDFEQLVKAWEVISK